MQLYCVVWTMREKVPEWTHVVMDHHPTATEQMRIISNFMLEQVGMTADSYELMDYGASEVFPPSGYEIKIIKKDN